MRSIVISALALLLLSQICFSQVLKETNPALAGMSAERLKRIDQVLQEYVDKQWIAGGSAIIRGKRGQPLPVALFVRTAECESQRRNSNGQLIPMVNARPACVSVPSRNST